MQATLSEKSAAVFAAGGDEAISHAISEGIISSKLAAKAKKIEKTVADAENNASFWKEVADIRRRQQYESTCKRREEYEEHRRYERNSIMFCLFIGFALGVMFDMLLVALAQLGFF